MKSKKEYIGQTELRHLSDSIKFCGKTTKELEDLTPYSKSYLDQIKSQSYPSRVKLSVYEELLATINESKSHTLSQKGNVDEINKRNVFDREIDIIKATLSDRELEIAYHLFVTYCGVKHSLHVAEIAKSEK